MSFARWGRASSLALLALAGCLFNPEDPFFDASAIAIRIRVTHDRALGFESFIAQGTLDDDTRVFTDEQFNVARTSTHANTLIDEHTFSLDGTLDGRSVRVELQALGATSSTATTTVALTRASTVDANFVFRAPKATCGNGEIETTEGCDDENASDGDGCDKTCAIEDDWTCAGTPSACRKCGDRRIEPGEACDDGNARSDDGCSATCELEADWTCDTSVVPTTCKKCGSGRIESDESCDDGNVRSDDGCSATCAIEDDWTCTGTPSACTPIPEPNAYRAGPSAEFSTSRTTFIAVDGARLEFSSRAADTQWIVFVSGRARSTGSTSESAELRVSLDGTPIDLFGHAGTGTAEGWAGFLRFTRVTGSTVRHTVRLEIRSTTASALAFVDTVRIVAVRLPSGADVQYIEQRDVDKVVREDREITSLSFTPSATGDYVVLAAMSQSDMPGGHGVQGWLVDSSGKAHPDTGGVHFSNATNAWEPFFTGLVARLERGAESRFSLRGTSSGSGDWWRADYRYRRRVDIVWSTAPASPSGYSIDVTIDHAALVRSGRSLASGDDVRVLIHDGGTWTELDRMLDPGSNWDTSATTLWFQIPDAASASATYYVHYGNPSATNPHANGDRVFPFWDSFDSPTLDESRWSADGPGSHAVSNGQLALSGTIGLLADLSYAFDRETIWEAEVRFGSDSPAFGSCFWCASNGTIPSDALSSDYIALWTGRDYLAAFKMQSDGDETSHRIRLDGLATFHVYAFEWTRAGELLFTRDGIGIARLDADGFTGTNLRPFMQVQGADPVVYDWIRVRRMFAVEPTIRLGGEERVAGTLESSWAERRILAFRADAFSEVVKSAITESRETDDVVAVPVNSVSTAPRSTEADFLVVQSMRLSGDAGVKRRGTILRDGNIVLETSHRAASGRDMLGHHHSAAMADVVRLSSNLTCENRFSSPEGGVVEAADSLILILRW